MTRVICGFIFSNPSAFHLISKGSDCIVFLISCPVAFVVFPVDNVYMSQMSFLTGH